MPATLVPATRTTYTPSQLVNGLVEGWFKLFKTIPKKESIGVLFAQNAIETGLSKSMWNNNIGNIKYISNPTDPPTVKYCMLSNVWEIVNGKRVVFQPPHPATWFRAFDTLADGVEHHLNFLKSKRYKVAWSAVESGSVKDFAHLLKVQGYYTAPEADYVKGMNYYFNSYIKSKDYESAIKSLQLYLVSNHNEASNNITSSTQTTTDSVTQNQSTQTESVTHNQSTQTESVTHNQSTQTEHVTQNQSTQTESVTHNQSDKLVVRWWQGIIYNILANAPWIKFIKWIGSLFIKK
jgi:hypothetical protein